MNEALLAGLFAVMLGLVKLAEVAVKKVMPDKSEQKGVKVSTKVFDKITAIAEDVSVVKSQTDDLWRWHNKEYSDGVKMWYVRPSLERSIEKLADNVDNQTKVMQAFFTELKDMHRELEGLRRD